jgi:phage tail sheath gpL-like
MAISFNEISANIRTPGRFVEFDSSRAVQGSPTLPKVGLCIGLRESTGTVAKEVPTRVNSADEADTFWGSNSVLAAMCRAFKEANPTTELWAVAVDADAGGTQAHGHFIFTGTSATEAGTIYAYIGGELIEVPVSIGDTPTNIADAMEALVNADSHLPVSGNNTAGDLTLTFKHKGTLGNSLDLRVNYGDGQETPAGITTAITAMGSGATDSSYATAISSLSDATQYTHIAVDQITDTVLDLIEAELDTRWSYSLQIPGLLFTAIPGSVGTMTSAGNARNSKLSCLIGSSLSPTPPWIWAAVVAAVDAAEDDPARPRTGLELTGVLPPARSARPTWSERNTLLTDGVSTFTVGSDDTVYIERLITTYQTNPGGVADTSYLDVTTVETLAALSYTLRARLALRFPRHKLADDGTLIPPGQAMVTPSVIKAEIIALALDTWVPNGWVEDMVTFKDELVVERNENDPNRVDTRLSPDLVNAFNVFAGQVQFIV